jgi:outer membrane protein assembly factor BamD
MAYAEDSKRAYDAAVAELAEHNWNEAVALLRELKRNYPYSKYARLAELRIADADYDQEKYTDAVRGYRAYIHDHRSDADEISYASARIAEAQFQEIGDSLLLPASEQRDQSTVQDAYRELKKFLAEYPDAQDSPRLRTLLAEVTARLIRHELTVARFYMDRENYDASVSRITTALATYADAESPAEQAARKALGKDTRGGVNMPTLSAESRAAEPEALLLLGEVYMKTHRWAEARGAFTTLLRKHGSSGYSTQAKSYLAHLQDRGT